MKKRLARFPAFDQKEVDQVCLVEEWSCLLEIVPACGAIKSRRYVPIILPCLKSQAIARRLALLDSLQPEADARADTTEAAGFNMDAKLNDSRDGDTTSRPAKARSTSVAMTSRSGHRTARNVDSLYQTLAPTQTATGRQLFLASLRTPPASKQRRKLPKGFIGPAATRMNTKIGTSPAVRVLSPSATMPARLVHDPEGTDSNPGAVFSNGSQLDAGSLDQNERASVAHVGDAPPTGSIENSVVTLTDHDVGKSKADGIGGSLGVTAPPNDGRLSRTRKKSNGKSTNRARGNLHPVSGPLSSTLLQHTATGSQHTSDPTLEPLQQKQRQMDVAWATTRVSHDRSTTRDVSSDRIKLTKAQQVRHVLLDGCPLRSMSHKAAWLLSSERTSRALFRLLESQRCVFG